MRVLIFCLLPFLGSSQNYSLSLTGMYDIIPRFGVTGVMEEQGITLQSSILVGNDFYFQTKMGVTLMAKKKKLASIDFDFGVGEIIPATQEAFAGGGFDGQVRHGGLRQGKGGVLSLPRSALVEMDDFGR